MRAILSKETRLNVSFRFGLKCKPILSKEGPFKSKTKTIEMPPKEKDKFMTSKISSVGV